MCRAISWRPTQLLKHVEKAVKQNKRLDIAVLGTGSSALGGAEGAGKAYPARLQAALERRLPGVTVNVVSQAKMRQTTADMAKTLDKLLIDAKPTLVLWQTGTVDAMRGIDPGRIPVNARRRCGEAAGR